MANPPITIGPFTNVPAPGSPIRSNWPQQITQYVVDAFTQAGKGAVTADASGNATIGFPVPFRVGTIPVVVACQGWQGQQEILVTVDNASVTRSGFFARFYNTNTKAVAVGGVNIAWIAFGFR